MFSKKAKKARAKPKKLNRGAKKAQATVTEGELRQRLVPGTDEYTRYYADKKLSRFRGLLEQAFSGIYGPAQDVPPVRVHRSPAKHHRCRAEFDLWWNDVEVPAPRVRAPIGAGAVAPIDASKTTTGDDSQSNDTPPPASSRSDRPMNPRTHHVCEPLPEDEPPRLWYTMYKVYSDLREDERAVLDQPGSRVLSFSKRQRVGREVKNKDYVADDRYRCRVLMDTFDDVSEPAAKLMPRLLTYLEQNPQMLHKLFQVRA